MAAFSQGQKQRELDYDGNDTARSCLGTAGPIPALCCCYPRYLASCCALHHFCGFRASLVSFSPFFQPELEEKRLTAPWGHQGVQINGFDIAWKWGQCCRMALGASGVPWDPPDHDLETGLQKPNSSRFYAGLSLNGCWIMFSWVLFWSLSLVLRGRPVWGELTLILGKVTFVWKCGSGPSLLLALWRFLCHMVVLLCPIFGDPWVFLGRGAGSCAELPHALSPSSTSMSPRVAGITLQLSDLPANACMYVSPGSPQAPRPSLPLPLPGVLDWDPTWGWRCLWLHQRHL